LKMWGLSGVCAFGPIGLIGLIWRLCIWAYMAYWTFEAYMGM
jgi:hypothetical protein